MKYGTRQLAHSSKDTPKYGAGLILGIVKNGAGAPGRILGFKFDRSGPCSCFVRPYNLPFVMHPVRSTRPPKPTFHIIAQPVDLLPADRDQEKKELDAVLDKLRGEVGLTGLSVWAATAPADYFRARESLPRCVHSDGGLYFEPRASSGGCRPPVAANGAFTSLTTIGKACERYGLSLRLRLATATLSGLARYYPEFASRSAFDDPSRVSVCLLNPAVQDCMAGIVSGIPPQLGASQIVLDDFRIAWFDAFDRSIRWPVSPGCVERLVLGTCFCSACMKAAQDAGVDAHEARRRTQTFLQLFFARGTTFGGSLAGFRAEQPALEAYAGMQAQSLNSLLTRIVESARVEVLVARGRCGHECAADDFEPHIPAGIVTRISGLSALATGNTPPSRNQEASLPASALLGSHAEEFVASMARLGEWGYAGVEIDDYVALPDGAFPTLRQGIRFADLARVVGRLPPEALAAYGDLAPGGPRAALEAVQLVLPSLRGPGATGPG